MDEIVRMMTGDGFVKAMAVTGRDLVERARQIHHTWPVATAALGRLLMAASMMGNQLKEENGSVTLRIKGDGPLGGITVVSDSAGNARGYVVNPLVDLPLKGPAKLDVGSAVGKDGSLTVIKDMNMKEPYVGTIPLVSGEIAEDITSYFAESEQIPSACALGVLVDVDQSVRSNTVKEVLEEAGLEAEPLRLIAVQDRNLRNTPPYIYGVCKIFVLCRALGGQFRPNLETLDSGWFSLDRLPPLAEEKTTTEQIALCFAAYRDPNWVVPFD